MLLMHPQAVDMSDPRSEQSTGSMQLQVCHVATEQQAPKEEELENASICTNLSTNWRNVYIRL